MRLVKMALLLVAASATLCAFAQSSPKKHSAKRRPVIVAVYSIYASKEGAFIDGELKPLVSNLDALAFTSYKLVSKAEQPVELGAQTSFTLPGKVGTLYITPTDHYAAIDDDGKPAEVIQIKAEMPALNTTLRLYNGATVIIGGMPYEDGKLLVALRATALPLAPGGSRAVGRSLSDKSGGGLEAGPAASAPAETSAEKTSSKSSKKAPVKPTKTKAEKDK
ncbi:MAG: hypothetical protein Kow0090_18990 [Myxococcota bacterium]